MRRKASSDGDGADDQAQVLAPITPVQQQFIEHLLTGKSMSTAARLAGISRRTALYWLAANDGPVRVEYDKQRALAFAEFDRRVSRIHELALGAIESLLSAETPPFIRIQAVRMLYDAHLKDAMALRSPRDPAKMVNQVASEYYDHAESRTALLLWDDRGKPRIND